MPACQKKAVPHIRHRASLSPLTGHRRIAASFLESSLPSVSFFPLLFSVLFSTLAYMKPSSQPPRQGKYIFFLESFTISLPPLSVFLIGPQASDCSKGGPGHLSSTLRGYWFSVVSGRADSSDLPPLETLSRWFGILEIFLAHLIWRTESPFDTARAHKMGEVRKFGAVGLLAFHSLG